MTKAQYLTIKSLILEKNKQYVSIWNWGLFIVMLISLILTLSDQSLMKSPSFSTCIIIAVISLGISCHLALVIADAETKKKRKVKISKLEQCYKDGSSEEETLSQEEFKDLFPA